MILPFFIPSLPRAFVRLRSNNIFFFMPKTQHLVFQATGSNTTSCVFSFLDLRILLRRIFFFFADVLLVRDRGEKGSCNPPPPKNAGGAMYV